MALLPADGSSTPSYTILRVALFFFAAGLWIAGVLLEDSRVTGAAIGVAVVGLVVGLVARRQRAE